MSRHDLLQTVEHARQRLGSRPCYGAGLGRYLATGLLGFASFLAAQGPEASAQSSPGPRIKQDIDLARLVDLCAEQLQLDVHYESGQLTGAVSLRPTEDLSGRELWALMNRALVSRGFTTIQMPGEEAIAVVKLDEAGSLARLEESDLSNAWAGYVKVVYELRYASPADVLPTIRHVMSGSAGLAVALGKTNSIMLADLRPNLNQVFQLLDLLDAAPNEGDGQPVRVFWIRNRSAVELADLLNGLIGSGFLDQAEPRPSEESNPQPWAPGPETLYLPLQSVPQETPSQATIRPPSSILPITTPAATQATLFPATPVRAGYGGLVLSADANTNTLFAIGEARLIDKLEGLVKTLDVMSSQVMLEVLILSLSDSDSVNLGVEIRGITGDEGTIVTLSSLFGLVPDPATALSGFTGVVLDPGDFDVLVNALQILNKGRALNIPKVLVNSNQTANLASVLQTPFLSTNATTVVATTTFGGTQDAGTTIEVRPQIAEGDHLVLEYDIVLSAFVGPASDPSLPPPRQQNNLHSVATIPDGYTVALGGLETTTGTDGISQVPFLGSLPLMGWLFRSESTLTSHARFYVFIRASILRNADDFRHLKFLSDIDMHRAGVDPGWPEVEPELIR